MNEYEKAIRNRSVVFDDFVNAVIEALGKLKCEKAVEMITRHVNRDGGTGDTAVDALHSIGGKKLLRKILPKITNKQSLEEAEEFLNDSE